MTITSASRAATQNAKVVTAIFIPEIQDRAPGGGRSASCRWIDYFAGGSVVAAALAGTFSLSPTLILSVGSLFADLSALTVVPNCVAIFVRLSPDLTS